MPAETAGKILTAGEAELRREVGDGSGGVFQSSPGLLQAQTHRIVCRRLTRLRVEQLDQPRGTQARRACDLGYGKSFV